MGLAIKHLMHAMNGESLACFHENRSSRFW